MQLVLLDFLSTQELVDDVLCHVEALRLETELAVHVDDPLEKECPRGVSDLSLNFGNVLRIHHEFELLYLHVLEVFLRVFGYSLRILNFLPVQLWHFEHFRL